MNTNGASTSEAGSSSASAVNPVKKESRKPKYSKFTQQELPACKPLLTPGWVITTFLVVGVIFIPIGAVTLLASNNVVEIVHRYDASCLSSTLVTKEEKINYIQNSTSIKNCTVTLTVPKKMEAPVYVYYQLDNFYQNHRRYVKSYDAKQLRADDNDNPSDSKSCKPEQTLFGKPIVPCGLIAWSLFNDSYTFNTGSNNNSLPVNRKGISWKSDRDDKFGKIVPQYFPNNPDSNNNSALVGGGAVTGPLDQNEDLIVWMRTAALPTFRKLWGKIETDLQENQVITVAIINQYNTYTFSGKKKLVLSTTSWLGGKNNFLGIAYLTVGILCVVLAFIFFAIHLKNPRPLGDPSYLSWNRKAPTVMNSSS